MRWWAWSRDIGASCLAALTALPLAVFLLWILGLSGLLGALVFGISLALIAMVLEMGFRDSADDS